jgi:hypothetical protein
VPEYVLMAADIKRLGPLLEDKLTDEHENEVDECNLVCEDYAD